MSSNFMPYKYRVAEVLQKKRAFVILFHFLLPMEEPFQPYSGGSKVCWIDSTVCQYFPSNKLNAHLWAHFLSTENP